MGSAADIGIVHEFTRPPHLQTLICEVRIVSHVKTPKLIFDKTTLFRIFALVSHVNRSDPTVEKKQITISR